MADLEKVFAGPGGLDLMTWLTENGHIDKEIPENPAALAEHNLVKKLFAEAGVSVMPTILDKPLLYEENEIDKELRDG